MELRNLITFTKIAELKSFSKAAEALNYTQSTVTSQIKQLETELGVQLFDRIGKKVYLTEIGQKILANSYNIIADSNKIKELTENTSVIDGKLRFGTLFSFPSHTP